MQSWVQGKSTFISAKRQDVLATRSPVLCISTEEMKRERSLERLTAAQGSACRISMLGAFMSRPSSIHMFLCIGAHKLRKALTYCLLRPLRVCYILLYTILAEVLFSACFLAFWKLLKPLCGLHQVKPSTRVARVAYVGREVSRRVFRSR